MNRALAIADAAPPLLGLLLAVLAQPLAGQGRGARAPASHFRVGSDCARCHSLADTSSAMRSALGHDVSPHGLWQSTMMANSFRDPYFHAQLEKESQQHPEASQLCLRCHAPMAHHDRLLAGKPAPLLAEVADSALAKDGVSCTVCHQITAEGLGDERTFSGRPVIGAERRIFGPYRDPVTAPMQNMVGYLPEQGMHIRESALCATCHTLFTSHQGAPFPEQTPYLEWRNSAFSTEEGDNDEARSCQQCHMAESAPTRIARNPMGRDFLIPVRDGYRAHAFVGGNAFMLDLLAEHREELGVVAGEADLRRTAAATRRQLAEATATVAIEGLRRDGSGLEFSVAVTNLCGHKFPSGYPARRAWLHVQVRAGREVVFESGAFDAQGRILGLADELDQPHVTLVERSDQAPIFEMIGEDPDGRPTTSLVLMAKKRKDTRLLPRGWRRDGPHAEETAPVGVESDLDFVAGGDRIGYRIPLPASATGRLQVVAWLHYQPIPPAWVDGLRREPGPAAQKFLRYYDAARPTPETVAVTTAIAD